MRARVHSRALARAHARACVCVCLCVACACVPKPQFASAGHPTGLRSRGRTAKRLEWRCSGDLVANLVANLVAILVAILTGYCELENHVLK